MNQKNSLRANEKYLVSNLPFCIDHPKQYLINVCKECNYPLCPMCIKLHYSHHEQKNESCTIESAETARQECYDQINQVHEVLKKQKSKMEYMNHYKKNEMKDSLILEIRNAYESLIIEVKKYFRNLEEKTIAFVDNFHLNNPEKIDHFSTILTKDIEKVSSLKGKLETVEFLKPVLKWNSKYEKSFFASRDDYMRNLEIIEKQLPHIEVNRRAIETLPSILERYVSLEIPSSEIGQSTIIGGTRDYYSEEKSQQKLKSEIQKSNRNELMNDDLTRSYELKRQLIYANLGQSSKKKVSFLERQNIDLVKSGTEFSK